MSNLVTRYPNIPMIDLYRVKARAENLTAIAYHYLSWSLVTRDVITGDVLLERRQYAKLDKREMVILCGLVGYRWYELSSKRQR